MLKSETDCESLEEASRELAFGLKYSDRDLNPDQGGITRFARRLYIQTAHCEAGIAIEKMLRDDRTATLTM